MTPEQDTPTTPPQPEAEGIHEGWEEDLKPPAMYKPSEVGSIGGPDQAERDKLMNAAVDSAKQMYSGQVVENTMPPENKDIIPPPPVVETPAPEQVDEKPPTQTTPPPSTV